MRHYAGFRWDLEYQFRDYVGTPVVVMTSTVDGPNSTEPFFLKYYDYAPYGRQIRDEILERRMTLQFTGHERDWFLSDPVYAENNSVRDYMRARYYSPADARFLRPDPAFDFDPLNPASFNLYAYARGNPIAFTDPTGTAPTDAIQAGFLFGSLSFTFKVNLPRLKQCALEVEQVGLFGHDTDNGYFFGSLRAGGAEMLHSPTVFERA